ncbi:MAG: hypothetical protein ACR2GD_05975 [Pyrinomonadaceae bacterium]
MKKLPSDIQKWNKRWGTEVVYCCPSSGGAVGIIFVWTGPVWSGGTKWDDETQSSEAVSGYKFNEAAFVIKPIQGSAAPTKFAEHILTKIGGARSPHSVPIKRTTVNAQSLVNMLAKFRDKETNPKIKQRWQAVFEHYRNADVLLIQETQLGITELGDQYKPEAYSKAGGGLEKILTNQQLMINLGKLFAADALIGNGDRLSNMNTGNVVFKNDGTISAIDSTTVLTSYQAILNDQTATQLFTSDGSAFGPNHWIKDHALNSGNTQVMNANQQNAAMSGRGLPTLAPGGGVSEIFDVKTWWTNKFKKDLEEGLRKHSPNETSPTGSIWFQAELWFASGVNIGIQQIDSKLSGFNWLLMKNKYKSFISKFGGDPNLDWMNFKVRRKYIKLRKKGFSEEQTLKVLQDYIAKRMPGL